MDDVRTRFDTSGYIPDGYCVPGTTQQSHGPLPVGLNKKVIGLMKDELEGKIMTEFVELRPKLCSYKKLDDSEDKKCKGTKKRVVKKTLTLNRPGSLESSTARGGGGADSAPCVISIFEDQ